MDTHGSKPVHADRPPSNPDDRMREESFHLHPLLEDYCDACHSDGMVFPEQRPHEETCLSGSIIGLVALAKFWLTTHSIHHFINTLVGIDTKKIRIVPVGEMLQCGYCNEFLPSSTFVHHVMFCNRKKKEPCQTKPFYLSDMESECLALEKSNPTRNSFLDHVGVPITFGFLLYQPFLLLLRVTS